MAAIPTTYLTLDVRLVQNDERNTDIDEIRQTPVHFGWNLTVDDLAEFVANQDEGARYVIGVLDDNA